MTHLAMLDVDDERNPAGLDAKLALTAVVRGADYNV